MNMFISLIFYTQLFSIIFLNPTFTKGSNLDGTGDNNGRSFIGYKEHTRKDDYNSYNAAKQMAKIIDKLEVIDSKIDSLERMQLSFKSDLEKNSKLLQSLNDTAHIDDQYWVESKSCGGLVIGQTGKISFSSSSVQTCIWTIRTNYRSQVKIEFYTVETPNPNQYGRPKASTSGMRNCTIQELDFQTVGQSGSQSLKTTQISPDSTYMFRGPIVFLTCIIKWSSNKDHILFEGLGPRIHTNVLFQNFHFNQKSGHVHVNGLDLSFSNRSEINSQVKTIQYATIVIHYGLNGTFGSSKLSVQKIANNQTELNSTEFKCENNTSLMIYENFTNDAADIFNCCEIECYKKKFLVEEGYFLSTASVQIGDNVGFTFEWNLIQNSDPLPSTCGGVSNGRTRGTIVKYYNENNARCIWLIHMAPKTEIQVDVTANLIERNHDHLVAVEFDGDIPKTTSLTISSENTFTFTGRMIAIIFYSDNTVASGSFTLHWNVQGKNNRSLMSNNDQIFRLTEQQGDLNFSTSSTNNSYVGIHIFIVNPQNIGPNTVDLQLQMNSTESVKLRVFASKNATITPILQSSHSLELQHFNSWDGLFFVTLEVMNESTNVNLSLSWEEGGTTLPPQYNSCGGTMYGSSGVINYHAETLYPENHRCIWIINCPHHSVIFNLIKSKFQIKNNHEQDYLLVDVVDSSTGTLVSNYTKILCSQNRTQTVDGPLIIVTFQSNQEVEDFWPRGFVLEFSGVGNPIESSLQQQYRLVHKTMKVDEGIFYPLVDMEPLPSNEILVFALSTYEESVEDEVENDPVYNSKHRKISFTIQCNSSIAEDRFNNTKDNLTIYTYSPYINFQPSVECSISTGDIDDECIYDMNLSRKLRTNTFTSWNEEQELQEFSQINVLARYSAFLMILKPKLTNESQLSFNISWKEDDNCGGIIFGESGIIEYKPMEYYNSYESCVWIIEAPGKESIQFQLVTSGLKDNDNLYLYQVVPSSGSLGSRHTLHFAYGYQNSYYKESWNANISSSVAILTFKSKSQTKSRKGFQIKFSSTGNIQTSKNPSYRYHIHRNSDGRLSIPSNIQGPMSNNAIFVLVVNPLSEKDRNEVFALVFKDLELYVNENCTSNSLRFYSDMSMNSYFSNSYYYNINYLRYTMDLRKSFRSYKNPKMCSKNTSDYMYLSGNQCDPTCYDVNGLRQLPLNQSFDIITPFIAIYKSVNEQTSNQTGIQFSWKVPSKILITTTTTAVSTVEEDDDESNTFDDY